jgi:hypothetical protein
MASASPASIVVLVHGSRGMRSQWPLIERATERLLDPVSIRYFEWDGSGGVHARAEAAGRLQADLVQWQQQEPRARFYVVTHGDGGTVALHALAKGVDEHRVAALVCLSAPFVDAQLRLPEDRIRTLLIVSTVAWIVLFAAISQLVGIGALPALALAGAAAALLTPRLRSAERHAEWLVPRLALPDPLFPRMYILRSPREDASVWLTVSQLQRTMMVRWRRFVALCGFGDKPAETPARLGGPAIALMLVALVIWAGLSWRYASLVPRQWLDDWFWIFGLFYLCMSVGAVLVLAALLALVYFALAALPLLLLTAGQLSSVVAVRDVLAAVLHLEISVEPLPPGTFECCQLPWRVGPNRDAQPLHAFDDPAAADHVGRWLREAQDARVFAAGGQSRTVAEV